MLLMGRPFPRLPPRRPIAYSASIQDRVGASFSWRLSEGGQTELRVSYWHLFLPTMLALAGALGRVTARSMIDGPGEGSAAAKEGDDERSGVTMRGRVGGDDPPRLADADDVVGSGKAGKTRGRLGRRKDAAAGAWQRLAGPLEAWAARRTGSLGITWGGPIPEPPGMSCHAILTTSGYYPREMLRDFLGRWASDKRLAGGRQSSSAASSTSSRSTSPTSTIARASPERTKAAVQPEEARSPALDEALSEAGPTVAVKTSDDEEEETVGVDA